ncbi:MAG: hypothetical protein J5605_10165, partial [Bacteroidales bacterium]|nr:hypothetical protein [Bacteroidales bacterium]
MTYDTEPFWKWFDENNEQLTMLSEYDEETQNRLLNTMQQQLENYCGGLTFEISEPSANGRRVVFTA